MSQSSWEQFGPLNGREFFRGIVSVTSPIFSVEVRDWPHRNRFSFWPYYSLSVWTEQCPCPLSLCISICKMNIIVVSVMNVIVRTEIIYIRSWIPYLAHHTYSINWIILIDTSLCWFSCLLLFHENLGSNFKFGVYFYTYDLRPSSCIGNTHFYHVLYVYFPHWSHKCVCECDCTCVYM